MTGTQPTSGTGTDPMLIKEMLYSPTLDPIYEVELPSINPKPEIISWNHRFFLLNHDETKDEKYIETVVWFIN